MKRVGEKIFGIYSDPLNDTIDHRKFVISNQEEKFFNV